VFIFAVEAELEAMDRERIGVHRRGRKPDLSVCLQQRRAGRCGLDYNLMLSLTVSFSHSPTAAAADSMDIWAAL
jgi:hypothetical protein